MAAFVGFRRPGGGGGGNGPVFDGRSLSLGRNDPRVLDLGYSDISPNNTGKGNRQALQAVFDYVAGLNFQHRINFQFPAELYEFDQRSLFLYANNIDITGAGSQSTILKNELTPILYAGRRNPAIGTGDGFLVDAYGKLDPSAAPQAGYRYGLDCSKGRLFDVCGNLFRNGDVPHSELRQFTMDLCVDASAVVGDYYMTIAGWESGRDGIPGIPLSWDLRHDGGGHYLQFCLSLEKNAPRDSDHYVAYTPRQTDPFIRASVQVDLDGHGGAGGPVMVAYVAGKQVSAPFTSTVVTGRSMLENFLCPFSLGACGFQTPQPIVIYGCRFQQGLRYNVGSAGDTQTLIDGRTLNDAVQFFDESVAPLFMVPFQETPADLSDHPSMNIKGGRNGAERVVVSRKDQGQEFPGYGIAGVNFRGLRLAGYNGSGGGIVIPGSSDCTFSDIAIDGTGVGLTTYGSNFNNQFNRISFNCPHASIVNRSSYSSTYNQVNTSQEMTPRVFLAQDGESSAEINTWQMPPGGNTQMYFYSDGGSLFLNGVLPDNEQGSLKGVCENFAYSHGSTYSAHVEVHNTTDGHGTYRKPVWLLDGPDPTDLKGLFQPAVFRFQSSMVSAERIQPGMFKIQSPVWIADLVQDRVYDRMGMVYETTANLDSRVKVEARWATGPLRSGWFRQGMTEIIPRNLVSGRPAKYVTTGTGAYGTPTPPKFFAVHTIDNNASRLAVDLIGHSYWSAGTAASDTIRGFWSDAVQVQNLDWIFRQVPPSVPALPASLFAALSTFGAVRDALAGEVAAGLGYARQPVTFTFPVAGRAEASALSFGPATGNWDDGKSYITSAVAIVDPDGKLIAFVDFDPKSVQSGDDGPSFAAGVVFCQHQPAGSGGFTHAVEDTLAKAWLGGQPLPTLDLYLALSTAPADIAGGPVEPADGAYARLAAPPSVWSACRTTDTKPTDNKFPTGTDNLTKWDLAVVTNTTALNFAAPTSSYTAKSLYWMDAATAGNVVACSDLVLPRTVASGDAALGFDVGAIRVTRS